MNYNSLDRAKTPKPAAKNATGKLRDGLLIVAAFLLLVAAPKGAHAQVIYVTNVDAGTIGEYNASTGAAINASLVTGLSNPFGLALDGSGHLYVASANSGNSGSGTIGEYNAGTGAAGLLVDRSACNPVDGVPRGGDTSALPANSRSVVCATPPSRC